jgi:sulfur-oxidizing protein SoxZ
MSGALSPPRVRIPRSARAGEVIEIRTLAEHPMETGLRHASTPAPARDMLTRLVVRLNGEVLFMAELRNGTSTNPYHVFFARIERRSEFTFVWSDERGRSVTATAVVTIA